MRYSIEPRDKLYEKRLWIFIISKKNIGTHATKVAKSLRNKYS